MFENTRIWTFDTIDAMTLMEKFKKTTRNIPWDNAILLHLCHTIALSTEGEMHEVMDVIDIKWRWDRIRDAKTATIRVTIEPSRPVPNVGPVS